MDHFILIGLYGITHSTHGRTECLIILVGADEMIGENIALKIGHDHIALDFLIAVVGEIQTRQYLADDGSKRYVTEVVAEEIEFLSPAGRQTIGEDPDGFMEIAEEEFPF